MVKLFASLRHVFSKEALNMETNPLDVVRALGPSLVPFFKTVAIYFVISPNITNRPLYAVIKCLPIISLILFVLMHYRTRLAPKKGDTGKLQLLEFESEKKASDPQPTSNVQQQSENDAIDKPTEQFSSFSFSRREARDVQSVSLDERRPEVERVQWGAILYGEKTRYSRLVLIGLLASLVGDICLVWSAQLFLYGLLFFAFAHFTYAAAFSFTPFNPLGLLFVIAVGIFYHGLMQVYFTGIYAVAAPFYSTLIGTMWWRALSRLKLGAEFWKWTSIASCFGATLFALSDSLLGVAKFAGGFPYINTLVMLTYYAAQFGIAVSVIDTYRESSASSTMRKKLD